MKLSLETKDLAQIAGDVIAVLVSDEGKFSPALAALDKAADGFFTAQGEKGNLPQKKGGRRLFVDVPNVAAARVIVFRGEEKATTFEKAATELANIAADSNWNKLILALSDKTCALKVAARALTLAAYRFNQYKSECDEQSHDFSVVFSLPEDKAGEAQTELDALSAWARGVYLTRDLANTPPNVCNPAFLGETAEKLAAEYEDLSVTVLRQKEIEELKMGALLGVAQGSAQEPRFIVFEYKPAGAQNDKPIVLVGKGVTFDSGGISLKPGANMDEMKYDMGGAAAVFGALKAASEAKLPLYIVGLVAAVENMPDGNATRPGDILTSMSGKTIEVLNTDAEGRLILCDALTYAERYEPQAVIDMATLTGACVIALGSVRSGLMSNNDELAEKLLAAGEATRDWAWRLPLDEGYKDMLKSPFADLPNISNSREAGTITAAAFLSAFAENYPWAHLDIAGTAWQGGAKKGASGRPVALLLEYFRRQVA